MTETEEKMTQRNFFPISLQHDLSYKTKLAQKEIANSPTVLDSPAAAAVTVSGNVTGSGTLTLRTESIK